MKRVLLSVVCLTFGTVLSATNPIQERVAINGFMKMLDGSEEKATEAVKMFCTDDIIEDGMIPFGKNAKIVSEDGNCVIIALMSDGEVNKYELCEEDGKIVAFDWYYDEDDEDE